jgi:hypothetical protein
MTDQEKLERATVASERWIRNFPKQVPDIVASVQEHFRLGYLAALFDIEEELEKTLAEIDKKSIDSC